MSSESFSPSRQSQTARYGYIASLGRGGMADVYLVSSRGAAGFIKLLVIKELRPELSSDEEFVEMFLNEARLAARLDHPHVVQTYDVARTATRFFLTMEYLDGQPLHRVLSRLGREDDWTRRLYLKATLEMLSGLHYAHELKDYDGRPLGIVHRDVSPHNLFLLYTGHVKLVDFGIAKVTGASLDTRSGTVKGKIAYMAPEQAMGGAVDRRADVYSSGVMLWEALAGRRMWSRLDEVSILKRLLRGEIPSLEEIAPATPRELLTICNKALSHDVEQRYPTAEAMRVELLTAIRTHGLELLPDSLGKLVSSRFVVEREELAQRIQAHMQELSAEAKLNSLSELSLLAAKDSTPTEFANATSVTSRQGASQTGSERNQTRKNSRKALRLGLGLTTTVMASLALIKVYSPSEQRDTQSSRPELLGSVASPILTRDSNCNVTTKPTVELTGEIERDSTLTCDKNYLLKFNVFVLPGATLTIEKGTTVMGDRATHAALIVQPGGRLVAEGSETEPVVFTSAQPSKQRAPGDWGGIVLLGRAPINLKDQQGRKRGHVEGITFGGEYGGDDPSDDSGSLRYVRIEYPGNEIGPGNELNGLTMAGVGKGTTIDSIQVRQASDDCFEFFGGTVDAKHLICQGSGDDAFDWDYGYTGRLQYLILQGGRDIKGADNGLEGDNDPNGSQNLPRSAPLIYNATLCGTADPNLTEGYGLMARRGTRATLINSIFTGFAAGLDVRDRGTEVSIQGSAFFGNMLHDVAYPEGAGGRGPLRDDDHGLDEVELFFGSESNIVASLELIDCFNPLEPNFAPRKPGAARPVLTRTDDFVEAVDFAGAVRDVDDTWYKKPWTRWSDR